METENGNTPLHHAVKKYQYDMAEVLLPLMNTIEQENEAGKTALDIVCSQRYGEKEHLIAALIERGARLQPDESAQEYMVQKWEKVPSYLCEGVYKQFSSDMKNRLNEARKTEFKDFKANYEVVKKEGGEAAEDGEENTPKYQ